MRELFALIERVAASDANILVQGEHGTGKELVADAIHRQSLRAHRACVRVNCAAIPRDLLESELFGHRKGAFTGATGDRVGLLEMAHGGSLLLDEIGEMSPYLQTKLLRVLEEREYRPVGGDRTVKTDFRLICATNVDLDEARHTGRFREDLYFRINTITLVVPPLRERIEDVPALCEHFITTFNARYGRQVQAISSAALDLLLRSSWPGNVRELENACERAVLVCAGHEITPRDLPESLQEPRERSTADFAIPHRWTLADLERVAIEQTLHRTNWNKQEAAQILGLYRPTLYSKMKKHHIRDARAERRAGTSSLPH
jgi:DNA-binding NtrC family response regulator